MMTTLRLVAAVIVLAGSFSLPAQADTYWFSCKNQWNQSISVKIPAATEKEARYILKNEKPYSTDFSLCSKRAVEKDPEPSVEAEPQAPPSDEDDPGLAPAVGMPALQ